jgi:hypothetical protein
MDYFKDVPMSLDEQIEVSGDDVIMKGISVKDHLDAGLERFKKEFPEMYKISREVFDDKTQKKEALAVIRDNAKKFNKKAIEKMDEKKIKEQIILTISSILGLEVHTKALKISNKSLANKIQMMKR